MGQSTLSNLRTNIPHSLLYNDFFSTDKQMYTYIASYLPRTSNGLIISLLYQIFLPIAGLSLLAYVKNIHSPTSKTNWNPKTYLDLLFLSNYNLIVYKANS